MSNKIPVIDMPDNLVWIEREALAQLRAGLAQARAELSAIDNALARRPAIDDLPNRYAKIERMCAIAGRAEKAEAEVEESAGDAATLRGYIKTYGETPTMTFSRAKKAEVDLAAARAETAVAVDVMADVLFCLEARQRQVEPHWDGTATPQSAIGRARDTIANLSTDAKLLLDVVEAASVISKQTHRGTCLVRLLGTDPMATCNCGHDALADALSKVTA